MTEHLKIKSELQANAIPEPDEVVVLLGSENTGRWTKREHAAFLQGIEKYGKEWKKVAGLVRTRTVMQTRTHAQKYYEKLSQVAAKANGTPGKAVVSIGNNGESRVTSLKPSNDLGASSLDPKKETVTIKKPAASAKGEDGKKNLAKSMRSPPRGLISAMPFPMPTSLMSIVTFTDKDIVVPINETAASRPANKEYMDLMKANCFIFHSLPGPEQVWFVRNLTHFLTTVRGRRWIAHFSYPMQYQLIADPANVVQTDFRMDPLKVAAFQFHPFWLLGEIDPSNAHNGAPFVHRTIDGTWKAVTTDQVKDILKGEGPKNLLILPPCIQLTNEAVEKGENAELSADIMEISIEKQKSDDESKVESEEISDEQTDSSTAEKKKAESSMTELKRIDRKAENTDSGGEKADLKEERNDDGNADKRGHTQEKAESKTAKAERKGRQMLGKPSVENVTFNETKDNNNEEQVESKTKRGTKDQNEPKEKSEKNGPKKKVATDGDHGGSKGKGDEKQTKSKDQKDEEEHGQRRSKRPKM